MKNFFIYIGFICWMVTGNFALAQPGQVDTKTVKGKECYVHIVEQGQTLFAISRIYKTDVKNIKSVNDGLDESLDIGQIIYVPMGEDTPRFIEHEVKRKETVYGISKEYGISPEQLNDANPEIKEGLKKGQVIQIPVHLSSLDKYSVKKEKRPIEVFEKNPDQQYKSFIAEADKNFEERKYEAAKNNYMLASEIKPNEAYPKDKIAEIKQLLTAESIQKEPKEKDIQTTHPTIIDDSTFYHIVMPKETLYAISKRFMVDQKTIKKMNNGLPDGLRAGDTLILPRTGIENKEILVKDPYQQVGTTDSLKKPTLEKKDVYNVVFMVPFYLDKNSGAFTSPKGSDAMYSRSKWAMEFYMGALVAIDSLKKLGGSFNITTLDTKGDTAEVKKLLQKSEVQNADLIIGPFYGKEVKFVAQWVKQNHIPMLVPFNTSNRVLLDNPYVIKASPSKSAMIDASVRYVLDHYRNANLFIIKSTDPKDKYAFERFKSKFEEYKIDYKEAHDIKLTETGLGSSSGRDLNNISEGGAVNVFIVPSEELTMASNALTRLNKVSNERKHNDSKLVVIGMSNWLNMDQIDFEYKNKLNLHVPSDTHLDYNSDGAIEIVKKFRESYNYDPSDFAFQGFDLTFFGLGALKLAGKNFIYYNDNIHLPLTKNQFDFQQVADGCGFENQNVFILRVKDHSLVDAKKHLPLYVEQEQD